MNAKKSFFTVGRLIILLAILFVLSQAFFLVGNIRAGSVWWQAALSSLILAIPLGLLYFSIGLLATAGWQKHTMAQVQPRLARLLYWTPRIAGILIALFVSLFALDVFEMEGSLLQKIGAFLIHAAPAIGLGLLMILAWRWEWVGFAAFTLGALFFLRFGVDPGMLLLFSGPMAAIAGLFLMDWLWRKELRAPRQAV